MEIRKDKPKNIIVKLIKEGCSQNSYVPGFSIVVNCLEVAHIFLLSCLGMLLGRWDLDTLFSIHMPPRITELSENI